MLTRYIGGKRQRGVSTIEFAIAVPVCLFLFLAVSEFGRAIWHYNTLTRSVRDAARFASNNALLGSSQVVNVDAQLISDVGNVATFGTPTGSTSAVLPGLVPDNFTVANEGGGIISVTGTYAYQPLLGAVLPRLVQGGTISTALTMRAQVTMRAIG
jgi:Flp pilus assembly protein TadG